MRFSIQHGLTACNVRLSAPCVAGHAPKLTINGTAFTVATVRIVGYPYLAGLRKFACQPLVNFGREPQPRGWQLHKNVLLKRIRSPSQAFLVISRSVRPLSHRNQERSQMLPSVIKSEDRRTRQARSPCSRVGS